MFNIQQVLEAKEYILSKTAYRPTIGVILGSGLGNMANEIKNAVVIPYEEIPYFTKSEVVGHANELVIGELEGKTVAFMKGRYHYYEGYSLVQVAFAVRVLKAIGVEDLLITNSCGAINTNFNIGDLMLITDHINLVGTNPLIGPNNDEFGVRFPDSSTVYNLDLRNTALKVAEKQGLILQQGVYAWWVGPAYETPAEMRMIRTLGADAVGMSTVPEAMVAVHANIRVMGISCLTGMAAGIMDVPLEHEKVIEVVKEVEKKFIKFVRGIIIEM